MDSECLGGLRASCLSLYYNRTAQLSHHNLSISMPSNLASPIQNEATTKLVSDNLFLPPVSSVMNQWGGWGCTKVMQYHQ